MNVFFLSSAPNQAAQFQCDRHLHTSLRDTLILLSSVIHSDAIGKLVFRKWESDLFGSLQVTLFDSCQSSNPWLLWACKSPANFNWLARHADAIYNELNMRGIFGKKQNAAKEFSLAFRTSRFVQFASYALQTNSFNAAMIPPQIMPAEFINPNPLDYSDVVESYRDYYFAKMAQAQADGNPFVWTNRKHPYWMETRSVFEIPSLPPRLKLPSSIRPLDSTSA